MDPARPPPRDGPAEAGLRILEPPAHPDAEEQPVLEPLFGATRPRPPAHLAFAPDGVALDMERFFDVASPEGVVVPLEATWPTDLPEHAAIGGVPARRDREAIQPPEYLSLVGGPAERRLIEQPPREEPPPREQVEPPGPPGFASPDQPQGDDPRAPGQDACAQSAHYVFPKAQPSLFTPQQPEARGGGGGGGEDEQPSGPLVVAGPWVDPCPCYCFCIHFSNVVNVFVKAGELIGSLFDLFGEDRTSLLGVSTEPAVVLSTPDGFVEHVRDVVARRDRVGYGAPASTAPGAAAPTDGVSATFAPRASAPRSSPPRLLWPDLDGTLATEVRSVAPVGPGPGIPGIGAEPLAPASGSPLRAAPGALPAGIAPAGDGLGAAGDGRLRPQ